MSAFSPKAAVRNTGLDSVFYVCFRPGADIRIFLKTCIKTPPLTVNTSAFGRKSGHSAWIQGVKKGMVLVDGLFARFAGSPLKGAAHSLRSLRVLSRDYVGARVERSPCGRLFEFRVKQRQR